jgi:hypothetical protein
MVTVNHLYKTYNSSKKAGKPLSSYGHGSKLIAPSLKDCPALIFLATLLESKSENHGFQHQRKC